MSASPFSDETLMAYADRELDPAAASAVEAAMAQDAALAARVSRFAETRRLVREAADAFVPGPVPADLAAHIRATTETAKAGSAPAAARLRPAANSNRRGFRLAGSAVAASLLALAMGGAGFWLGSRQAAPRGGIELAGTLAPDVSRALSSLPSGGREAAGGDGREIEIIATFRIAETTCREFELQGGSAPSSLAVACLADGNWTTNFAVVSGADGAGYVPASSSDAVEAYLASAGAGEPLAAADEEAFLAGARR